MLELGFGTLARAVVGDLLGAGHDVGCVGVDRGRGIEK